MPTNDKLAVPESTGMETLQLRLLNGPTDINPFLATLCVDGIDGRRVGDLAPGFDWIERILDAHGVDVKVIADIIGAPDLPREEYSFMGPAVLLLTSRGSALPEGLIPQLLPEGADKSSGAA